MREPDRQRSRPALRHVATCGDETSRRTAGCRPRRSLQDRPDSRLPAECRPDRAGHGLAEPLPAALIRSSGPRYCTAAIFPSSFVSDVMALRRPDGNLPARTDRITMTAPAIPPRATRREWIGLAVLALPCLLYSMDLTVLILAVPHLSADLGPTGAQMLWIVDIYGFLVAGSLITMGTLGDRIGRRKLLMIGATAFGFASIFAAYASSAEMLIFARALLGVAAATLSPSTLSLIRNMFADPRERTFAIGIWISSFSAGGALGPLIGGALLTYFHWGSVFLIAVPVMVLLL